MVDICQKMHYTVNYKGIPLTVRRSNIPSIGGDIYDVDGISDSGFSYLQHSSDNTEHV